MLEFKTIYAYGIAPVSNPYYPSATKILQAMAEDGWDFAGIVPGEKAVTAENTKTTSFLFKREKSDKPSLICSQGGIAHQWFESKCMNCGGSK